MVAFLALMYSVYLIALVVFGVLLRTNVLPGDNPVGGTIVPAGIAGGVIVLLLLVALIPQDIERRLESFGRGYRRATLASRLAKGPATARDGHPHRDQLRLATRGAERSRSRARSASGRPTSPCSGRPSRPSAATCRSRCSSRASSSGWPPT